MATTKDRGPGLAYTTRPDGRVRGTFDGRYFELQVNDITDEALIVRRLRHAFNYPEGCPPIPKGGLPPLD